MNKDVKSEISKIIDSINDNKLKTAANSCIEYDYKFDMPDGNIDIGPAPFVYKAGKDEKSIKISNLFFNLNLKKFIKIIIKENIIHHINPFLTIISIISIIYQNIHIKLEKSEALILISFWKYNNESLILTTSEGYEYAKRIIIEKNINKEIDFDQFLFFCKNLDAYKCISLNKNEIKLVENISKKLY